MVLAMRMNSQIKRFQESPTPAEAFRTLSDLQQADSLTLLSLQNRVSSMETAVDDLYRLSRKEQARDAAQIKRDNDVTLAKLVGQLGEAPPAIAPQENRSSTFDQDSQSEIDYR